MPELQREKRGGGIQVIRITQLKMPIAEETQGLETVSYTHLDVYKRQTILCTSIEIKSRFEIKSKILCGDMRMR